MTKRRGPIGAEYSSPGPVYSLPPLIGRQNHDPRAPFKRAPAWALGEKHGKLTDECGPGPAYNVDSKLLRNGKASSYHFSLYSRPVYQDNDITPDPGKYNYDQANGRVWKSSPSYSFGLRNASKSLDRNPAPNSYLLDPMLGKTLRSEKPTAPCYSILSRGRIGGFSEDMSHAPGPGAHNIPETGSYKRSLPSITIAGRHPIPSDNSTKPGPAQYYPEQREKGPAYSFGSLHSQYRGQLIVHGDIDD